MFQDSYSSGKKIQIKVRKNVIKKNRKPGHILGVTKYTLWDRNMKRWVTGNGLKQGLEVFAMFHLSTLVVHTDVFFIITTKIQISIKLKSYWGVYPNLKWHFWKLKEYLKNKPIVACNIIRNRETTTVFILSILEI